MGAGSFKDPDLSIVAYGSCLDKNDGRYVAFEIAIRATPAVHDVTSDGAGGSWNVYRRYAAFKNLGEAVSRLAKKLAKHDPKVSIPVCPGPGGLLASHTPEFLERRRAALEVWLRNLVAVPNICEHCPALVHFLIAKSNTKPKGYKELARKAVSAPSSPAPAVNILSNSRTSAASPRAMETPPVRIAVKPPPSVPSNGTATRIDNGKKKRSVKLEDFELIKVIGKGSFGKVMLVKKRGNGWFYAMKVLRKQNVMRRNQVEHTQTERNVLGYIRHPFIVSLNYAFQTEDKLFFVLDYCAGGELFFHLGNEGKFSEQRAKFYAAEMALALGYIHEHDIVYRDLKPENVLLDHTGHVMLTDFGLSKEGISESFKGATSFCGTPEYLAPEILAREGHGQAVDWWSLGVLLYEMLTGLPPFYCRSRERLFEKIKTSRLKFPRFLSETVKDLLSRLLMRNVAHRMGATKNGFQQLREHEFFGSINWDDLLARKVTPPWKPPLQHCLDTSQFDDEFTSMPINSPPKKEFVRVSKKNSRSSKPVSANYKWPGFSFVADDSLIASNPVSIMRAFSETEKGKEDEKEKEAESAQ